MNLLFWYRSLMQLVGATLVKLIATATSGLVSFTTNVIRSVKVTCEFSPVQEGTGDPSPDNVRPISGWTGCEPFLSNGNRLLASSDEFYPTFIRKGTQITASIKDKGPGVQARFYRKDRTFIDYWTLTMTNNGRRYRTFTISEDVYYFNFGPTPQDVCVREGSNNYDFLPHATSVPISWESEAGTVHGGTVTLNEDGSADLVATHICITINPSFSWTQYGDDGSFARFVVAKHSGLMTATGLVANERGSHGVCKATWDKNTATNIFIGSGENGDLVVVIPINIAHTTSELRNYLQSQINNGTPVQLYYQVATPQTYHFDNIGQLQSFIGENNIWHDMNGDITVEYWNKQ